MSYRILLADDHAVFRAGLRRLLEDQPDLEVVGEAATGLQAVAMARRDKPDVLVLDVQMPEMPGPEVVFALRRSEPAVRIMGLSAYEDPAYVERFVRGGASGYVTKDRPPAMIVQAVRQVAEGMPVWLVRQPLMSPLYILTEREREVLGLLGAGLSNDEIAHALHVSESTVRNTLTTVYEKIGVAHARAAVAWAWRHHLVNDSPSR